MNANNSGHRSSSRLQWGPNKYDALPRFIILHLKRFKSIANGSNTGGNRQRVDFPREKLAFGSVCNCTDSPKPEYDLMSVIQHITTPGRTGVHFITIARQTVHQQWQLFDDSIVRAPNASDWCSTQMYVMVYQRHENTGPSKQHVTQKDSPQRTDHVVDGSIRRRFYTETWYHCAWQRG